MLGNYVNDNLIIVSVKGSELRYGIVTNCVQVFTVKTQKSMHTS